VEVVQLKFKIQMLRGAEAKTVFDYFYRIYQKEPQIMRFELRPVAVLLATENFRFEIVTVIKSHRIEKWKISNVGPSSFFSVRVTTRPNNYSNALTDLQLASERGDFENGSCAVQIQNPEMMVV
jgi:hypothetical protein